MIIDFHAHVKRDQNTKKYLVAELLDDMVQNDISMRMVSTMQGKSISHQNDFIIDLVQQHPDKFIGCAVINPKEDDSIDEALRVAGLPEIKAFEFDSLEHGYLPESCPNIDEIIDIAEQNNLVIKLFTGTGFRTMPGQWAYYTKRHPNVKFIFLHMGTNDFGYGCIDLVSQYVNLFVETSNQYELPILRKAFRLLPPEKFLFGSMYPSRITYCSINTFNILNLSQEVRNKLFYQNSQLLLGL